MIFLSDSGLSVLIVFDLKSDGCSMYFDSGDPNIQTTHVSESVFINSGDNPYELLKDSIKYV